MLTLPVICMCTPILISPNLIFLKPADNSNQNLFSSSQSNTVFFPHYTIFSNQITVSLEGLKNQDAAVCTLATSKVQDQVEVANIIFVDFL